MSFVIANPEMLAAAATDLAGIRSAISAATAAAAAPTIQVAAAGADEVSLAISALFGQHAQAYQALSAQATIFHDQFVQALTSGGNLYAAAESHTVEQMVLNAINAPTQTLFGRPLIGDGANGTAENPDGQNGGLLFGNGGNGFTQTTAGVAGGNGGSAGLIGNGGAGAVALRQWRGRRCRRNRRKRRKRYRARQRGWQRRQGRRWCGRRACRADRQRR
ncbi:hypothetical protein MTBK_35800 [Mycobacterium tuberculosis K]|nr:hypothetical protein MTBK_35800 [Mycobacterium tuberculosis K]